MALRALIVDDCSVTRFMIAKTLRLGEIEFDKIYYAMDGKEGLAIMENHSIDLLLMDINMPVMDGREMLRIVRQRPYGTHLPVLIISSESNKNQIEHFREIAAGFIHKPFTVEQLRNAVRNTILQNYEE